MKSKNIVVTLIALAMGMSVAACADDHSGVSRSKKVKELTAAERKQFCEWGTDTLGGAGTKKTCNGAETTVSPASECEASAPKNNCTVGVVEDCILSTDGDLCKLPTTKACEAMLTCLLQP